jgi:hypothetical protein
MASRQELRKTLIQRLYEYSNSPNAESEIEDEQIFDLMSDQAGKPIVNALIIKLLQERLLRQTRAGPIMYEITDAFLDEAEEIESEVATVAISTDTPQAGTAPTFLTFAEAQNSRVAAIPASDRVVPLNHNSDPYREAIRSLDAAVLAFREDHLDNLWGPEKGALLTSIEAGRQLLDETEVRVATVFATVISPLKIIRDKYREAIIAGLVTAGVDHMISLVDNAIGSLLALLGVA